MEALYWLTLFFYLCKVQFKRCITAKNLDNHLEGTLLAVYFLNHTTETTEWSIRNLDGLVNHEWNIHLLNELRLFCSTNHAVDILLTYGRWIIQSTKETETVRHKAKCMSHITHQLRLYEEIAWQCHLLFYDTFAITQSGMLLNRQQYLRNMLCQKRIMLALCLYVFFQLCFLSANGTHSIPFQTFLCHFISLY